MKFSDYIGIIYIFLGIVSMIVFLYLSFIKTMLISIRQEDYKAISIILILFGGAVIIYGYWMKLWVYGRIHSFPDLIKYYDRLREKYRLKEKINLAYKFDLWTMDGYIVKICNRVGITLIVIGLILLGIYIFVL